MPYRISLALFGSFLRFLATSVFSNTRGTQNGDLSGIAWQNVADTLFVQFLCDDHQYLYSIQYRS